MRTSKMIYKGFFRIVFIFSSILLIGVSSCKKYLGVGAPSTLVSAEAVYSQSGTAAAVITEVYADMSKSTMVDGGYTSMSGFLGLSADELALLDAQTNVGILAYYRNDLNVVNGTGSNYWAAYYSYIYTVNSVIEGVEKYGGSLADSVKHQLVGEAKFTRAFFYFYLVNLFGDVPLALTTSYTVNNALPRADKSVVWTQIIQDLSDAEQLLSSGYMDNTLSGFTTERVRPTKWAAKALLARVYLYRAQYDKASQEATDVITGSSLYKLTSLDSVFRKNSAEAIWQLQPVMNGYNTYEGVYFNLPSTGPSIGTLNPYFMNSRLVNSFYGGDRRRDRWMNSMVMTTGEQYYYPWKYKATTTDAIGVVEYSMVLRLGEVYLIDAEARAMQGDIDGALGRLNAIRARAGVSDAVGLTQTQLMDTIVHERQVELFTESGHRWLDLKRTGRVDSVMNIATPLKGHLSWRTYQQLYPVPNDQIIRNTKLTQNEGY